MSAHLIEEEELMSATGYGRRADLERCLREQGVRIFYGKDGRLFTTPDAFRAIIEAQKTRGVVFGAQTAHGKAA